jgi:Skp family chaperone for outer membrane proteins
VKVEPVIEAAAPAAPAAAAVKVEPVIEAAAPAAAVAEKSASEDSAVMGQMDIDKMLSEADTIPEESEATLNALEAALDADKLLAEASEFEGPHAEEEKLMGDFEEFVKKEGTNS